MIFNSKDHDSEEEDYFNAPAGVEKPKVKKEPALKPDDPRYYEQDDEWEHIRPSSRSWKVWVFIVLIGVLLGVAYAMYVRLFVPKADQQIQYGYVEKIERHRGLFDTFEGVLIPYKAINDTIEPYAGDIVFSAKNDHVAAELRRLFLANRPARVEYETYRATLPWRGESRVVITAVDTADVTKIWPVTLNHPLIPSAE